MLVVPVFPPPTEADETVFSGVTVMVKFLTMVLPPVSIAATLTRMLPVWLFAAASQFICFLPST